uniref:Ferric reductase NAD binding domain-containing protein n=1 Tax=Pinguiococcus pyrenoidosus TaxID=172671 RepID=A0A7R9U452_9STRA
MSPGDLLDKHEVAYNDFVSVHIKVHQANPNSWTRKLKDYIELLNPGGSFPYYFTQRNERGEVEVGRLLGPDGQQVITVDGPHSAPSEHYNEYGTVMLIGAGIGLTPCSSILSALLKFRWKKNFRPEILHFYWVVRQSDVDGFQWFIRRLTELEHGLKRDREQEQVDRRYYAEINIFVTGAKEKRDVQPMRGGKRLVYSDALTQPSFADEDLYAAMLNPTVSSKEATAILGDPERAESAPNRFQDIFVWNGRPIWSEIFAQVKENRVDRNIGVCFCGAPVIGAALGENCRLYSSEEEDCLFTLHKENF